MKAKILKLIYTILLFICSILLFSCKPQTILTERISRDTTIIKEVTKLVEVPGATITAPSINIDSLAYLIRSGIPVSQINRTLITEDPETKLRIGILIDELGNLTALCEQQDRLIQVQVDEITRLKERIENNTIVQKPPIFQRFGLAIFYIIIGAILSFILPKLLKIISPW